MNFNPPKLYTRIICITADYLLGAQLSACFHRGNSYFAVVEPPRSLHIYWRNEFIKLNNLLARINAEKIVFLNVDDEMTDLIKEQLNIPESKYIYIKNQTELSRFIDKYESVFKGTIECPPDREKITHALLEAKRKEFKLTINPTAKYEPEITKSSVHLLASDSSDLMLPVILANYAYSINADVQYFNSNLPYSPLEMYSAIADARGSNKRGRLAKIIEEKIKTNLLIELKQIKDYEFITFFTDDFQYGYFFTDIPNTHIFNKLLVGQFIAGSVSKPVLEIESAVLVDTGFFPNSETPHIKKQLQEQNVFIKELVDDKFTNLELDNFIQVYPYDFLFICSHGEFSEGERFKIRFKDSNQVDHIIVVDEVHSFDITGRKDANNEPLIGVKTITEFVELDNQPWYQKTYKPGSSATIVEDFRAIDSKDWDVLERKKVTMRFSNTIVTKDKLGTYIPMIQSMSDPFSAPFVFNNACVSAYTMGVNMIFAGASFYIGTVKPVSDPVAVKTSITFFEKTISQNEPIAFALWEAQEINKISKEDRVYTSIGCHFIKFAFNKSQDTKEVIKSRITRTAMMRLKSSQKELEDNVKEKHLEAAEFLRIVIAEIEANK